MNPEKGPVLACSWVVPSVLMLFLDCSKIVPHVLCLFLGCSELFLLLVTTLIYLLSNDIQVWCIN